MITRYDLEDLARIGAKGSMHVADRIADRGDGKPGPWSFVGVFDNILLNQWYLDLFAQLQPTPPGGVVLSPANMALGYGSSATFTRPDTALKHEWDQVVGTATGLGAGPITTITLSGNVATIPLALANGVTIVVQGGGAAQNATVNPGEASGAGSIRINSFSPNAGNQSGAVNVSYTDTSIWVPQRMAIVLGTTNAADPVSGTFSFYLPASANSTPLTFTEAGLVYQTNTKFMSHVAFAYTKSGNTDLRIDYVLTRTTS